MLGKLLKHEFKATGRLLIPFYIMLFIFSIINKITFSLNAFEKGPIAKFISTTTIFAYIAIIIVIIVGSYLLIIERFYKNLVTREGYLMFTIPVKTSSLINAKIITMFFWTVISIILPLIALFFTFIPFKDYGTILPLIKGTIDNIISSSGFSNFYLLVFEMIIMLLLSIIYKTLTIYLSIAIGQSFVGKNKILSSFIIYAVLSIILQLLTAAGLLLAGLITNKSVDELNNLPHLIMMVTNLLSIIFIAIQYYYTHYFLDKKLNLE